MALVDYLVPADTDQRTRKVFCAIYALGFFLEYAFWAQRGILPYLTRTLGVNPTTYGFLESSFALYQLITSPIFGLLADRCGIKLWFVISEAAAVLCYGALSVVNSIPLLFLSRVPALFMHSLQSQYMVVTHLTDGKDRANIVGKLGLFHGLGMISGTFLGGLVTKKCSPRIAPLMSSVANVSSIVIILFFIPNDTKSIKSQRDQEKLDKALNEKIDVSVEEAFQELCPVTEMQLQNSRKRTFQNMETAVQSNQLNIKDSNDQNDEMYCQKLTKHQRNETNNAINNDTSALCCSDIHKFWKVICLPSMAIVIGIEVAGTFVSSLFFAIFSMAVMDFYGLDASVNGILLSFIGLVVMFCQGFLVGFLTKRYKDSYLIKVALALNVIGFLYLSVASKIYLLVLVMIPLLIGGTLSHIIFMVIITKIASDEDTGSALGIIFMLRGLMRAISPSVGGLIFMQIGFPFIGVIGYVIEVVLFLIVMFALKDNQLDLE